ncbi:hypothetical protein [Pseudorhodoplanes sp.]|uniref:hypothetical protein n=1 Tax=Pseudorhodoplanes sp. TaxID=1934341 RepID=UPI00391C422D
MQKSRLIALSAVAAAIFVCGDRLRAQQGSFFEIGIGNRSCEHWLSEARLEQEGIAYILGFWSGLNMTSANNRNVGRGRDLESIVGEVRKVCSSRPSMDLIDAAADAYETMAKAK